MPYRKFGANFRCRAEGVGSMLEEISVSNGLKEAMGERQSF